MIAVGGRVVRFPGQTCIYTRGKKFVITRKSGSDLLRYNMRVPLKPNGNITPANDGTYRISIPGIGLYFVYANQLSKIITPNGGINVAPIYEMSSNYKSGELTNDI